MAVASVDANGLSYTPVDSVHCEPFVSVVSFFLVLFFSSSIHHLIKSFTFPIKLLPFGVIVAPATPKSVVPNMAPTSNLFIFFSNFGIYVSRVNIKCYIGYRDVSFDCKIISSCI